MTRVRKGEGKMAEEAEGAGAEKGAGGGGGTSVGQ